MNFKLRDPIIFCICGKAQSGKGLVAKYIEKEYKKNNYKVIISPYTKYLKQYISEITGKKIDDNNKPRDLLQQISSILIKGQLKNENFFINRQIEDLDFYSYFFDIIIIPDVRFPKEIEKLKERYKNVISIGIKRINYESCLTPIQKKDITEISLDNYKDYDYTLFNKDIERLYKDTFKIINKLRKRYKMNKIIAIDGPAGSGKGTLSKALAERLNLTNIDTGATYRCVALKALREKLTLDNKEEIIKISKQINIDLKPDGKVILDGEDVTKEIRDKEVTNIVSPISSIVEVRKNMIEVQRKIAKGKDIVMEGRDITTVVFPEAQYKFYLDATLESRVKRRFDENQAKGIDMSYEEVYENIKNRDYNDMHKKIGALKRTEEQIYIDTTNLTVDEEVEIIKNIVEGDNNEKND